jgi:uncharacterized protein with HEPN domain
MARAPVEDRFRHMLDAVARLETPTAGRTFEDYAADWVIRNAVERNLERVAEASRHIPSELEARHKGIDWRRLAGIGNILRDAYPIVDESRGSGSPAAQSRRDHAAQWGRSPLDLA